MHSKVRSLFSLFGVVFVGTTACHAVLGDYAIDEGPTEPGLSTRVCESGQFRCSGDWIFECNANGTGWHQVSLCNSCDSERKCLECSPGEQRCNGAVLQVCNADQTAFEDAVDCGSPGDCNLNSGACRTCVDGEFQCDGAQLTQCSGGSWQPVGAACATPDLCFVADDGMSGECLDPTCSASGEYECIGQQLLRCQPGLEQRLLVETCASESECDASAANAARDASMLGQCQDGCQDGSCFDPECGAVGRVECNPDNPRELRECTASGWDVLDYCRFPELCNANDAQCDEPVCNAGQGRCVGRRYETCRDNRTGWEFQETCSNDMICSPNAGCVNDPCSEGDTRCNWEYFEECIGGSWQRADHCASSTLCIAAEGCVAPTCGTRGDHFRCLAQSLQRCNESLSGWDDVITCGDDEVCNDQIGACIAP